MQEEVRDELRRPLNENGATVQDKWGIGRLFDLGYIGKDELKEALS